MPFPAYMTAANAIPPRTIAVQDFASGSATGNLDVTSSRIVGLTPKAGLYISTLNDIANGASETPNAEMMIGFQGTAGTAYANAARSRDNVASTSCFSENQSGTRYLVSGTAVAIAERVQTDTFISGGNRLNFTTNDATDRRGTVAFFAGDGVTARADRRGLGTGTAAQDITSPGFAPNLVFFASTATGNAASATACWMSFGIATYDGATVTQRCVLLGENNAAAAGAPFMSISTSSIGGQMGLGGVRDYSVTVSNFDSVGFDLTVVPGNSANAGGDDIKYLAIRLAGGGMKLMDFTTPTSTGSSSITGIGFKPQFALVVLTNLETLDDYPVSTDDKQSGMSICLIGNEQWSNVIRIDAGADPTDTASDCQNNAVQGASATSTSAIVASLTGFGDANGGEMILNYSAVQGTAKKGFILFIE